MTRKPKAPPIRREADLIGQGVVLEPQRETHADELFELIKDPALHGYLDYDPPTDAVAFRRRLRKLESRRSPDGTEGWLNWVVREPGGAIAGYVQATVYPDGQTDIGYVIGTAFQRRGYATAAVRAMLGELAAAHGATYARATVDPKNTASAAVLDKLGFHRVRDDSVLPDLCFLLELGPAKRS